MRQAGDRSIAEYKASKEGQSYVWSYYDSGWEMARRCVMRVHPGFDWDPMEGVYSEEERKNHGDDSCNNHPREEAC